MHVTSSAYAREPIKENEMTKDDIQVPLNSFGKEEKDQPPKYISITFKDRSCGNKLLYCCYRTIKVLYVSLWYYFAPFYALYFYFVIFAI